MEPVILMILTVTYITYVITMSDLPPAQSFRDWVLVTMSDDSPLVDLVHCHWCVSFWVSAVVTGLTLLVTDVELPVLQWLGAPAVTGILLEIVYGLWSVKAIAGKAITSE